MTNEAALKSMAKMIQVMLPYEENYEPRETSTKVLSEIIDILRENNPQMNEFLPFLNYIFKQMDENGDTEKFDRGLMKIWGIINNSYPPQDVGDRVEPYESEDSYEAVSPDGVLDCKPFDGKQYD